MRKVGILRTGNYCSFLKHPVRWGQPTDRLKYPWIMLKAGSNLDGSSANSRCKSLLLDIT